MTMHVRNRNWLGAIRWTGILLLFLLEAAASLEPSQTTKMTDVDNTSNSNNILKLKLVAESSGKDESDRTTFMTRNTTKRHTNFVKNSKSNDTRKEQNPYVSSAILDGKHPWRGAKNSTTKRDSYLEALQHSHTSKDPKEGVIQADVKPTIFKSNRREYIQGPIYTHENTEYGPSKNRPSPVYGAISPKSPKISYGNYLASSGSGSIDFPPSDSYSLPEQSSTDFNDHSYYVTSHASYGPPQASYGPPSSSYGPPSYPQQSYELPNNSHMPQQQDYGDHSNYAAPYSLSKLFHLPGMPMIDFTWPLSLKLNAFTLAKILLKLIIFKMIVKFIAVICLLLFIPKLEIIKKGNKDQQAEDEETRSLASPYVSSEQLNALASMVIASYEKYEIKNEKSKKSDTCDRFECRLGRALFTNETWNDYVQLFESYVDEERRRDIKKTKLRFLGKR